MRLKKSLPKRKKKLAPDRPFDPALWKRAEAIANKYSIVIREEPEVDGYLGRGIELPNAMSDGPTPDACMSSTREALTLVVACMLEDGDIPPSPSSDDRRDQQVNVRLSAFEKTILEEAARSHGFRGISDFLRSTLLTNIRS